MPSVSRHLTRAVVLVACLLLAVTALAGCATTQDTAARKQAESKRILAARKHRQDAKKHDHKTHEKGEQEAMTVSSQQPSALNGRPQYEPCEECGAPLDPQQRYCVNCAARRGNGANPASRYFAAMSKRARRPPLRAPAKGGSNSRAAAVGFFALLPIAVAIGVVVGRSGNDSGENEALLEALRNRPAAVASTAAGTTGAAANSAKGKKAKAAAKSSKGDGKALAKTSNGTVHEVGAGYKPPAKKIEEDTKLVEANPEQSGENYIKAQQNLPDVTVVGGDPSEAPASSGKAGEP